MKSCFEPATPESQGVPSRAVLDFLEDLNDRGLEMHAFSILRHGKCIAQGSWYPYRTDMEHNVFSFSKSLTSMAMGFLWQEGKLSLSEKLTDIFADCMPETISENLAAATVRDLLIMGCGHETEPFVDNFTPDNTWLKQFFAHPFEHAPGTAYQYNTAGTNVLCALLFRKTGESLTGYLRPRLFDPLGIGAVSCAAIADGTQFGGAGFRLTLEDMKRFGQFFLEKGRWEGKQLLSQEWFDQACTKQIETAGRAQPDHPDWNAGYGFQFWMCDEPGSFRADGAFGQFAVVLPQKDAVILTQSSTEQTFSLMEAIHGLSSRMQDCALAPCPKEYGLLLQKQNNLALAGFSGVRNRKMETAIEGAVYSPEGDAVSFRTFSSGIRMLSSPKDDGKCLQIRFSFEKDRILLHIADDDGSYVLPLSTTGNYCVSSQPFSRQGVAGIARFVENNVIEAVVRNLDQPSGRRLYFCFEPDRFCVRAVSTIVTDSPMTAGAVWPAFLKTNVSEGRFL